MIGQAMSETSTVHLVVSRSDVTGERTVKALGEPESVEALRAIIAQRDALQAAATELLRLKDGPRDDDYREQKPAAWDALRCAVNGSSTQDTP
jgi:hypothetical protein